MRKICRTQDKAGAKAEGEGKTWQVQGDGERFGLAKRG